MARLRGKIKLIVGNQDKKDQECLRKSLIFRVVWIGLSKLQRQFYDERTVPPGNRPEKN